MIRRAAAVVVALALNPAYVHAQDTVLTVTVASADVHQGPSTVNPVIGHAPRGTVLPVSRNLGSWVKVAWPDAPEGVGYVHVTMGNIGPVRTPAGATRPSPRASSAPAAAPVQAAGSQAPRVAPRTIALPAEHTIGVGGLLASPHTFGATARAWRDRHVGIQFGLSRETQTSASADARATSVQFEPGVVYALFDRVSDYVWIRPYVGSNLSFRRQTVKVASESASDSGVGFRVFGGSELTFSNVPQFGLSVDAGYRRFPTPFAGFESDRFSASIAGHWYIK